MCTEDTDQQRAAARPGTGIEAAPHTGLLVRLLAGNGPVNMMTRTRAISNETKRELGWTPRYPTWRTGFTNGMR